MKKRIQEGVDFDSTKFYQAVNKQDVAKETTDGEIRDSRERLVSKVPTKEFKDNYDAIFVRRRLARAREREAEMQEKERHDNCTD